ncbi:MAG TPA: aminoglycoside phosphotransferase family protein [Longimicrobium sp.]|nr:aminoglycoside phosphotransferase family protein [Longimicrobium sp.]
MDEAPWLSDHAEAAARIERHLPDDGAELTPIGEGDDSFAFRLGTDVVRVAKHRGAADSLRLEACVMARIAPRLPFPVPRTAFSEPAHQCAFSVHAEVTGADLTREAWEALPPAAREAAAADVARFLDALHALGVAEAGACGVPRIDAAVFAGHLLAASAPLHPRLAPETRRRLDAVLTRESLSSGADRPPALLHRDFGPGHVLFDPPTGRVTGVIDFGDLALGDPARDFIYVYEDYGSEMLDAVLRHYTGEDAATLRPRIHLWFLLEAVEWMLDPMEAGRRTEAETEEGLAIVAHELDALGD